VTQGANGGRTMKWIGGDREAAAEQNGSNETPARVVKFSL